MNIRKLKTQRQIRSVNLKETYLELEQCIIDYAVVFVWKLELYKKSVSSLPLCCLYICITCKLQHRGCCFYILDKINKI